MTARPVLTTERFELWKPAASDLDDLVRLLEGEDMTRFLGPARPTALSQFDRLLRNAGSWALHGYGNFAVRRPGESGIIGTCGVFHSLRGFGKGMDDVPEAGWVVRQDWWGKGVAGEAMRAVFPWFDAVHGDRRVACMIEEGNTASERLAAALGFVRYDRHEPEDDKGVVLNLFERVPG
ncbi:GNAT family N-acetyltransferase [Novosphingobium mangrovi (ex Huang et al. 2023)]|uniref:GNAT family N-acetyltransferase n=1 Tax=Novosphingobium mangrovi (ex Huang et al. 2023) TaxID=2976432 RepID=A0ABT2I8S9_9SPHN|nr:GNAT family N-acetyltransferase [Novosphingobium mangrovi (ex Huang et al. 2023)]MCT2401219.1 GNAT family N-acetyltransferase [Novosphingobium mangrovi (ex Huang et al. 2023)]